MHKPIDWQEVKNDISKRQEMLAAEQAARDYVKANGGYQVISNLMGIDVPYGQPVSTRAEATSIAASLRKTIGSGVGIKRIKPAKPPCAAAARAIARAGR